LVILIVALVLFLSSYLDSKLSEQAFEKDLQDQTVGLAQELAASIGSQKLLETPGVLVKQLEGVKSVRKHLQSLDTFRFTPQGPLMIASTHSIADILPTLATWSQVREGRLVTALEGGQKARVWEVTAPIQLNGEVAGAIRVRSSLENADQLAARERRQSFTIMSVASVLIVGVLGWYLQHHVNRPIQTLVQTMALAEGGDLSAEAHLTRHDELGRLAASFNRMLRKIQQGYEEKVKLMARIENFNRELQAEIERATHELAARHEELRLAHAQFFEVQRQLSRAERLAMVGQLAAMLAHEVSTPLNSISGHAQLLLQRGDLDQETIERLKIIEAQIARVVEVLQMPLIASAPAEPVLKPVDANQLVQDLLALIGPVLSRKQVIVSTAFDHNLPAVAGDAAQLQQVVLNCLVNALDAMPNGGTIRLATQCTTSAEPEGSWDRQRSPMIAGQQLSQASDRDVVISIADTGVGIPPEDLDRIFEPFFTTKALGKGTGLGLSICRRIVNAHGGSIQVESRVRAGTTFRIMLPGVKG
jgi:signal transduction histidine kinase